MPQDLGPEPQADDATDIAATVYQFADMIADGKPAEAVDAVTGWVFEDPDHSGLRAHYLAVVAPLLAMGLIRHHYADDMQPDDLWILERVEDVADEPVGDDVHAQVMCQVLVRFLNDQQSTGHDLLSAHLNTHGEEGLFWVGAHALRCVAGIILSVRKLAR